MLFHRFSELAKAKLIPGQTTVSIRDLDGSEYVHAGIYQSHNAATIRLKGSDEEDLWVDAWPIGAKIAEISSSV